MIISIGTRDITGRALEPLAGPCRSTHLPPSLLLPLSDAPWAGCSAAEREVLHPCSGMRDPTGARRTRRTSARHLGRPRTEGLFRPEPGGGGKSNEQELLSRSAAFLRASMNCFP